MSKKSVQKKTTNKAAKSTSFAAQFAELEKIVAMFENNNLDLDFSLQEFERGLQIAAELKKTLDGVENNITKLKSKYKVE